MWHTGAEASATDADGPALHTLAVDVLGAGAHRQLAIDVPNVSQACPHTSPEASVCLMLQLPAALYFDPYELDRVLPQQHGKELTKSFVDVEMCVSHVDAELNCDRVILK